MDVGKREFEALGGGEGAIVVDLNTYLELGDWSAGRIGTSELFLQFSSFMDAAMAVDLFDDASAGEGSS
jgi:hypothetical protein